MKVAAAAALLARNMKRRKREEKCSRSARLIDSGDRQAGTNKLRPLGWTTCGRSLTLAQLDERPRTAQKAGQKSTNDETQVETIIIQIKKSAA